MHLAALLCCVALPATAVDLPPPLGDADFIDFDRAKAQIGQLLFYDNILSGNQNISCGTCHHHDFAGADGLSLGIGEGGVGLGPNRTAGSGADRIPERVPRNAPALWNLGHQDISVMFHDGRLSISDTFAAGYESPAKERLPKGLESLLAAQALFPMTSQTEMAGATPENQVGEVVAEQISGAWPLIAGRVRDVPEYVQLFRTAFDTVDEPADITIVEIANSIAAFIGTEWRNHDSPFDEYLRGRHDALSDPAMRGMDLFFGEAGCSECHAGPLLTDQSFHALALPAFGPGKTREFDAIPRDLGRMAETDLIEDAYRFRTPALRNVALTAPYGHNGAFPTLEGMVRHHADPLASLASWTPDMAQLPPADWLAEEDFLILEDRTEAMRQRARIDIEPRALTASQIDDLVAFLHALTGTTAETRPLGVPDRVPSGLPVD